MQSAANNGGLSVATGSGFISSIGINTAVSGVRQAPPPPKGKGEQSGPADTFQSQTQELHLQVTPSMLGTLAFQQKLAEYSAAGVAVQVELVAEGTKVTLPPGVNAAPEPPPVSAPIVANTNVASATSSAPRTLQSEMIRVGNEVGNAMGTVAGGIGGLIVAATGLCLGAAGGAMIAHFLSHGTQALPALLANGSLFSNLGVAGAVTVAIGAVSAAAGSWSVGKGLGQLMGKVAGFPAGAMLGLAGLGSHSSTQAANSTPPPATPATTRRSSDVRSVIGSALGGLGMLTGAAGGFAGGVAAVNGSLMLSNLALSGSAVAAGCVGAVVLGVVSAMGAFKLSKIGE